MVAHNCNTSHHNPRRSKNNTNPILGCNHDHSISNISSSSSIIRTEPRRTSPIGVRRRPLLTPAAPATNDAANTMQPIAKTNRRRSSPMASFSPSSSAPMRRYRRCCHGCLPRSAALAVVLGQIACYWWWSAQQLGESRILAIGNAYSSSSSSQTSSSLSARLHRTGDHHHHPSSSNSPSQQQRDLWQRRRQLDRKHRIQPARNVRVAENSHWITTGAFQDPFVDVQLPVVDTTSAAATATTIPPQQCPTGNATTILVTNVLTSPLATATVLYLARQCQHVPLRILGTDALFPNLQRHRAQHLLPRLRMLTERAAAVFEFVPTGRGLYPAKSTIYDGHADDHQNQNANQDDAALRWFVHRKVDWVLHFETTLPLFDPTYQVDERAYHRYVQTQSRWTMEHVWETGAPYGLHIVTEAPQQKANNMRATTTGWGPLLRRDPGRHWALLELPPVMYGPPFAAALPNSTSTTNAVFYQDAIKAVGDILRRQQQRRKDDDPSIVWPRHSLHPSLTRSPALLPADDYRRRQSTAILERTRHPYSDSVGKGAHIVKKEDIRYRDVYGLPVPPRPCASQCVPVDDTCRSSLWDSVIPVTQRLTQGCRYVVYSIHLSHKLKSLIQPESSPAGMNRTVCRIAFVSRQSWLVQQRIEKQKQPKVTQKVFDHNGWKVVWVDSTKTETDGNHHVDLSLPLIDPGHFFAPSVLKAMWLDYVIARKSLIPTSDYRLATLMVNVDRPAVGPRNEWITRPGTSTRKQIPVPAQKQRRVVLFTGQGNAGSSIGEKLPPSVRHYLQRNGGIQQLAPALRQWYQLYEELAQYKQNRPNPNPFRPPKNYHIVPYEWTSTSVVVHDLKIPQARDLRCAWLSERILQASAATSPSVFPREDLSLAIVLARERLEGRLLAEPADEWEEWRDRPGDTTEWSYLMQPSRDAADDAAVEYGQAEIMIRLMPRKSGG